MTETQGLPLAEMTSGVKSEDLGLSAGPKKLAVMALPAQRERSITNLGKVFGQFAELQQQMAEQVVALEDSVYQQRQDLAAAISELPEIRERINWLIASFFEQNKKDELMREKLNRHDATLATLVEAVRSIHEAQTQWQSAMEDILGSLVRAKGRPVPPLPEL
jgi:uncharacterized coiled-coil DUF342 family protein